MHTRELPVCNMTLFKSPFKSFWMGPLDSLLREFPILEHPHKNDFYTIIISKPSMGSIEIDHKEIDLTDARVTFIKPRCISKFNFTGKTSGLCIAFSEELFSLRYNDNILHHFSFIEHQAPITLRCSSTSQKKSGLLLSLLEEEYKVKNETTLKIIRSYLNILLFELDRLFQQVMPLRNTSQKSEKIKHFERLIVSHYAHFKKPSDYAALLHVTPNYLNKLCREETGQTAGDIIRKHVIIEAQRLLHFTQNTVNEIADQLGFENPSYFITYFKKQTQLTPEQFRKDLK